MFSNIQSCLSKEPQKKDRITGKTYSAYHLVESVRTERGPRQRIILYMGADFGLPLSIT